MVIITGGGEFVILNFFFSTILRKKNPMAQVYQRGIIGNSKQRLYRTLTRGKWFWRDEHPACFGEEAG